ncbi:MAG TPA: ATP-binding protein [Dongiaceae bacterium]|nr:ATP-binding protein [Dongiaceae bacterium]
MTVTPDRSRSGLGKEGLQPTGVRLRRVQDLSALHRFFCRHDKLATRIAATIVGAILLTQVIGVLLIVGDKWPLLFPLRGFETISATIASPLRRINAAPMAERTAVAAALDNDEMRVGWQEAYRPQGRIDDHFPVHLLRDRLTRELQGLVDLVLLETLEKPGQDLERPPFPLPLIFAPGVPAELRCRIWLRLLDGSWVTIEMREADLIRINRLPFFLFWMLSLAVILWLSLVVAKKITRPLHNFAVAAERLGTNLDQEMLPETGPVELRQATRAFNGMQARLKRFVEDRTQMLAAISHDLRTPISRLLLRADSLEIGEDRAKMEKDLRLMEHMIAATLDFVRDDTLAEPEQRVDLGSLIESLADDAALFEGNVRYIGPAYVTCLCRPMAVGRALGNIIDNAVKYAGDCIIDLQVDSDAIRIAVDDNGPGIPATAMEKVFEPFFRLDPARGAAPHGRPKAAADVSVPAGMTGGEPVGAGLGLSIARNVILAHGGEIALINRAAGGLRVLVTLPRGLPA